ncbi:MAG: lipopolysaccharide biosynthesis, partial [Candidatus Solibacter sp.]|nr:lipopolysaccharide biosynthesis [Candidatus Solibacter sp.]
MPAYDPFASSNPAEPLQARRNIVPVQYGILSCAGLETGPTASSKPLLERMWRHKWLVSAAGVLGLIGGCVATRLQTPIYRASSTLEVQNLNENFMNSRELNPTVTPGQDADVLTQAKLVQSWHLVDQVQRRLTANQGAAASDAVGQNTPAPSPFRAADVDWAASTLTITVPERTRVLEITCDSPDARAAAAFANTLAAEFAEASVGSRHYASLHTSKWLNDQIDELKQKLLRSQQELQTYVGQNELVFTSEHGTIAEERLRQIQQDLARTQAELVVRQARHELASKSPPETLPEILDSGSLRESQTRINELKRQLAELLSSFTPAYYKVERVQAQLATLEPLLQKETENVMGRIRNEYVDAKRREDLLIAAYQRQAQLVSVQAGRAVHYDILKREVDSERQLYESMLTRVKEVGMAAALGTGNIRIVDTANVPVIPRRPRPVLNAGVGSLCGLAAGGLLALLKVRANRTIREPGEAGECLNLPEFGAIPSIRRASAVLRDRGAEPASLLPMLGEAAETAPDRCSAIWAEPFSMAAESFRTIALSILFAKYYSRVLAVVSPMPKDGKTTVAVHLA